MQLSWEPVTCDYYLLYVDNGNGMQQIEGKIMESKITLDNKTIE